MKKILIINGPNLNMLGCRDPKLYGNKSYKQLVQELKNHAKGQDLKLSFFQSNSEGAIIDYLQKAYFKDYDGLIVNLGGYSHTSVAIRDTLEMFVAPIVEVHLSDITKREEFRHHTLIEDLACKRFIGMGPQGYFDALDYLLNL